MAEQAEPHFQNSFLARARYPKGKRRLQAILDATFDIVVREGLAAASQEAIAKRAGVTQSAVRHYFPTKDELLMAFFSTAIERLQQKFHVAIESGNLEPRQRLLDSASMHYARILETEDIYFFEATAFWGRNADFKKLRDEWYESLDRHYIGLLEEIHPKWSRKRCADVALQILTLILGGWVTLGSSRPMRRSGSRQALKNSLLQGIERVID
ncbi:MAG: TetR/AcrR family transcriptional regulator [Gammaproteobacteria bacterium]|nr:TetR/AcrR family transcriptional regulator [Gammaproteobacteria bacterium]